MIKLYGSGPSRWVRPYWTLQELGIPFETVRLNLRANEHRGAEYLDINPFGAIPAMTDGDLKMFQSAAICTYLADKHPEAGLSPALGTHERASYEQWVSFVIADLEQPLWRIARHTFRYPEEKRSPAEKELAKEDFRALATTLEPLVGDYLVGGRFGVADILMTYTLKWASMVGLLGDFPRLVAYTTRHTARPAFPAQLYG